MWNLYIDQVVAINGYFRNKYFHCFFNVGQPTCAWCHPFYHRYKLSVGLYIKIGWEINVGKSRPHLSLTSCTSSYYCQCTSRTPFYLQQTQGILWAKGGRGYCSACTRGLEIHVDVMHGHSGLIDGGLWRSVDTSLDKGWHVDSRGPSLNITSCYFARQSQKAVSAYLKSEQLLPFGLHGSEW